MGIKDLKVFFKKLSGGTTIEYTQIKSPYRSVEDMKKGMTSICVGVARDIPPYALPELNKNMAKVLQNKEPLIIFRGKEND